MLLLAGLIFAGGTLAVFLSGSGPTPTNPGIAFNPNASPTRLEIFEQFTPTPMPPTATPWFPSFTPGTSPTDFGSFFPSPSGFVTLPPPTSPGAVTPKPTRPPTPTPAPTPTGTPTVPTPTPDTAPIAKFNMSQQGNTMTVQFNNNSTGAVSWQWNFNDEGSSILENPPPFTFSSFGDITVTLTVIDADGDQDTLPKTIFLIAPTAPPPTPEPTPTETATAAPAQ